VFHVFYAVALIFALFAVVAISAQQENLEGSEALYLATPYGAYGGAYGANPYGGYAGVPSPVYPGVGPAAPVYPGAFGFYRR
ncbi:hypothetical protein L9F63_023128, partial [Diploptera punctata]